MFWSTSCVLRYSFKLFICLKCIVYCYYIKYDKSYYYTDNESRWFFNKRASSMRILFNSFSFLHFLLSFFISFSFTLRHLISVFIYFLIFLLSNFFFMLFSIDFILFLFCGFWMILIYFVCFWINICSISFSSWKFLSFFCLKIESQHYQQLKSIE